MVKRVKSLDEQVYSLMGGDKHGEDFKTNPI